MAWGEAWHAVSETQLFTVDPTAAGHVFIRIADKHRGDSDKKVVMLTRSQAEDMTDFLLNHWWNE